MLRRILIRSGMAVLPCLSALIMTPRLLAVAAYAHVAPDPAAVAAFIEKQPTTVRADTNARGPRRRQKRQRRDRQSCLEGKRRAWPAESVLRQANPFVMAIEPARAGRQEGRKI